LGDGPFRNRMEETARQMPHVHLLGFVPNVAEYFQAFDMILQPSYFEGLPLITLEAQHAGLRVAGSTAPGLLEALPSESHCLCAGPDDCEAHARHMSEVMNMEKRRNVPVDFLRGFDADVFAQNVTSGYLARLNNGIRKEI